MAINSFWNTLYITEQILKNNSVIDSNTDMKVLRPMIILAQDKYLLPVIGDSLNNDLKEKISNNSLNNDEQFLVSSYIQPLLIWCILVEAPLYMTYRFMNKGIQAMNGENSNPPSLTEIQSIQDQSRINKDFYGERLYKFLLANTTTYPSFIPSNADLSTLYPSMKSNQTTNRLYTGPKGKGYGNYYLGFDANGCCN